MRYNRRKFLFKIDRKTRGKNHYGQCPKCRVWHKKGDLVFSRRSKRYCKNCSKVLFAGRDLKVFDTINSNKKINKQKVKI
jgi:RNase P subunit RPR2